MSRRRLLARLLVVTATPLAAAACGRKGPLRLPDEPTPEEPAEEPEEE